MKFATLVRATALGVGVYGAMLGYASAETLKIGVIAPLTGSGAAWGIANAEAAKILAKDINAKGGLDVGGKKYTIKVIAYDDQYKAAESVSAYERLTTFDGVKNIFIMTSPAAVALKKNIETDKIVAYTTAATEKAIDPSTKFMFRVITTPSDYVPPFIKWIKDHLSERRVAIINPNDETGWDQTKITAALFKKNGFDVVSSELFERSTKDFGPMLTKLLATNPGIIELSGTPPDATGLIVRQARELGYKGKFTKNSGPSPAEILAAAGKKAAEGFISLLVANPSSDGYKHLAAEYKKAVGQEPNQYLVTYYDGINVMLKAIQKAGTVDDTAKIISAVPKVFPFKSVQDAEMTIQGQQFHTVGYVGVIKDGKLDVVGKF
ncbi:MAG: ABC transporter substrate-binding protein [Rhodospirillales bacterium]|nr:ABC transporter substrate-binding protein [Rhodospirillales bacterium]